MNFYPAAGQRGYAVGGVEDRFAASGETEFLCEGSDVAAGCWRGSGGGGEELEAGGQ